MKLDTSTWLLTATVVLLASLLVYLQLIGVSPRAIGMTGVVVLFVVNSSYVSFKRRRSTKQGIPQQATNWPRLGFLIVIGLAAWIALIIR